MGTGLPSTRPRLTRRARTSRNTSRKLSKDVSTYRPDLKVAKAFTLPASIFTVYDFAKYGQVVTCHCYEEWGKEQGRMHGTCQAFVLSTCLGTGTDKMCSLSCRRRLWHAQAR